MISQDLLTQIMRPREGTSKEFLSNEIRVVDAVFQANGQKQGAATKADRDLG